MKPALIIGSSVCDVMIHIDHFPQVCGDENIRSQHWTMGGCAYNVAHVLYQQNLPFLLFSPVGQGLYGQFVRQELQKRHIPTMLESSQNNGCCYCIIDRHKERTFLCEHGAEYIYQAQWFQQLEQNSYQCIYVCGLEIEEKSGQIIIDFLKQNTHVPLYFAPSPRLCHIAPDKMQQMLQLHPILHLNRQEIFSYTKETRLFQAASLLYQQTQRPIIVTLGQQGCYFYDGHQEMIIPSVPTHVYSTNGAGDTHIGGIIASRMRHLDWSSSLFQANQLAMRHISQKHP